MSAAVTRLRGSARARVGRLEGSGRSACRPRPVPATLDALVSGVWAALTAGAPVACPVCGDSMAPAPGGADGTCRGCRAHLS